MARSARRKPSVTSGTSSGTNLRSSKRNAVKTVAKPVEKSKTKTKDKKKRKKAKQGDFNIKRDIYSLIRNRRDVNTISTEALEDLNCMAKDIVLTIIRSCEELAYKQHRHLVNPRDLQAAAKFAFKKDIVTHAIAEGSKAVAAFMGNKE